MKGAIKKRLQDCGAIARKTRARVDASQDMWYSIEQRSRGKKPTMRSTARSDKSEEDLNEFLEWRAKKAKQSKWHNQTVNY